MARRRSQVYAALGVLLAAGAPLGLLAVELASGREGAGSTATYVYVALSTTLAFAVFGWALGRQADRLQELAGTDPLTGLRNRRAVEARLREELARRRRSGAPVSLLLIDVDGLKAVNDRHGHRAGDEALMAVAAALRDCARATDCCARWGGDEYAVVAGATDSEAALLLAERIRAAADGSGPAGVTVSIGVATLDAGPSDAGADPIIARADGALYRAKAAGRNRVVSA